MLTPGTGKEHPTETSNVDRALLGLDDRREDVRQLGHARRAGALRPRNVIKGWTEGVQLMIEGEKTRFWIPANLAYGDKPARPGAPSGMLVFDIELIDFQ